MARLREKLETARHSRTVRRVLLGLVLAAFVLAGVGLYMRWRAGTVEYAVNQLNQAVLAGNLDQLERLVDFASLSDKLAAAMLAARPGARPESSEDTHRIYRDAVQNKLLAMFARAGGSGGGEGGGHAPAPAAEAAHGAPAGLPAQAVPMEDEVFDILKKPTPILPADLLDQLKAHPLSIQARDEDMAILSTTVEHPDLKHSFGLRLAMQRTDRGWRVSGFGNSGQVVGEFLGRVEEMQARATEAFDEENNRQRLLMSTYYHIDECRSVLFPPDASGVVRLRLTLTGSNMGELDVLSAGSTCDLLDASGAKLAALRLENTRTVRPGEAFEHAWFYTFEERFPEVDALVAAGEVRCTAEPTTVSFGKGTILYIRSMDDLPGVRLE